jgi:hypothetical protein
MDIIQCHTYVKASLLDVKVAIPGSRITTLRQVALLLSAR